MSDFWHAFPVYSRAERIADAVLQIGALALAALASLWLLLNVSGVAIYVSIAIYCTGLLAMLGTSASYNMMPPGSAKEILRRIDHSAIFVMIAGTYTPFAANRLDPETGTIVLLIVWLGAAAGVLVKLCYPRRLEIASVVLYLAMGWTIVPFIGSLSQNIAAFDIGLLVAGGVVYSAGVVFHLLRRLRFHNVIWHATVVTAAGLHFAAIANQFSG